MPIKIIEGLPVRELLKKEDVYTIGASRAHTQDIRPLRMLILNLMPKKEETELHLLRLLGNTLCRLMSNSCICQPTAAATHRPATFRNIIIPLMKSGNRNSTV